MIIYLYNSLDCLKAINIAVLYTKFAYELLELKQKQKQKTKNKKKTNFNTKTECNR